MNASTLQIVLVAFLCAMGSSCATTDEETSPVDDVFTKPTPDYPHREYHSGKEGWVIIDYSVGRGGVVEYLHLRDSSGNANFEDSALAAVQNWRYAPGEEGELSVFLGFVHDGNKSTVTKEFHSLNEQANELIDEGEIERAIEVLAEARNNDYLTLSDLSYSFLTEGRIEGKRGDQAKQLALYRKAMVANGRWLSYENYLEALRGTVVLELAQGDIASAVRDYDLLTATLDGRKLASDLEEPIAAARAEISADPSVMEPYVVADNSVMVRPDQPPRHFSGGSHPAPRHMTTRPLRTNQQPSGSRSGSRARSGPKGGGGGPKD